MKKIIRFSGPVLCLFLLAACTHSISTPTEEITSIPLPATAEITRTPLPLPTATATIAPIGEIQEIPSGYVYLGDPQTMALGFNMDAGGGIGSLLYHGLEMIDDADFGRYFNFSPYDGGDQYVCQPNNCFTTWGWNPLQTGSVDSFPAKVLEYRRTNDSVYIKTQAVNWGHGSQYADVIFETWAWERTNYFELLIRLNHTGEDTHQLASAEFPAAYFGKALPIQYGYTGSEPFSAAPIQTYDSYTYDLGTATNPPLIPSENWLAFGNQEGVGLSLVVPNQKYLTPQWEDIFLRGASPAPIGYIAPIAYFETQPDAVIDLHFYLIPGDIEKNRAIIYDLLPHTSWTFDLNSSEGWSTGNDSLKVSDGVLTTAVSEDEPLTSAAPLDLYGSQAATIKVQLKETSADLPLCLQFLTQKDWAWDDTKMVCSPMNTEPSQTVQFDLSQNSAWQGNLITRLRLKTTPASTLAIDWIKVIHQYYGWEFDNLQTTDGWVALHDVSPLQIQDSILTANSTSEDPYMTSPYLGIAAATYSTLQLRMKVEHGNFGEIFFATEAEPNYIEENSQSFPIIADGKYHDYEINLADLATWKGQITTLRLDPTDAAGSFSIDYLRILPRQLSFDPFLQTNWDFTLGSALGWQNNTPTVPVAPDGLTVQLSASAPLTSPGGFYFYGSSADSVEMRATSSASSGDLCLQFTTQQSPEWNDEKKSCLPLTAGSDTPYDFSLAQVPLWKEGTITALRFSVSEPTALTISLIKVIPGRYAWEFNSAPNNDGWSAWNQITPLTVKDNAIQFSASGDDPYLGVENLAIPGADFSQMVIRMKTSANGEGQIFFTTLASPDWSEQQSIHFAVTGDGEYHEYMIDLSAVPTWNDIVTQIRLDPLDNRGEFAIDYIRIEKKGQ